MTNVQLVLPFRVFGENRRFFSNARWRAIEPNLAALVKRGPRGDVRRFLEAVVWILRSGAPWRDLATHFGNWEAIYRRYRRWALAGRWEALRRSLENPDSKQFVLIDSTIVKAHPHSAGALRRSGGQALGRSRGGLSTKLHALVTERGELLRYVVTGGQVSDITQGRTLVRQRGRGLIGDRAYDSNAFIAHLAALGLRAVIPSRSHRKKPRAPVPAGLYARRNVIERWFGRLKVFRRVATRYEKTALSYLGFVAVAAWLVAASGWCR